MAVDFEGQLKGVLDRLLMGSNQLIQDSIRYSVLSPGKRLRPRLVESSAQLFNLSTSQWMPLAIALEFVHAFTLIHDDLPLMDNDDFRRGRSSNHRVFGEATALLAGDALFALAFEVFGEALTSVSPQNYQKGFQLFSQCVGARGVIGGQASEMTLTSSSSLLDLEQMHAQKTGALFYAAVMVPALFAGKMDLQCRSLHLWAQAYGLAFQAWDDLEDAVKEPGAVSSVLAHLSPTEVRARAGDRLHSAMSEVEEVFHEKAISLNTLGHELLQRLSR